MVSTPSPNQRNWTAFQSRDHRARDHLTTVITRELMPTGENPEQLCCEAAFAELCAAAPNPASFGKTNRHRLDCGGNRQANRALHTIVIALGGRAASFRRSPGRRAAIPRRRDMRDQVP